MLTESCSGKTGPDVRASELCSAGDGSCSNDDDPEPEGIVPRCRSSGAVNYCSQLSVQAIQKVNKLTQIISW